MFIYICILHAVFLSAILYTKPCCLMINRFKYLIKLRFYSRFYMYKWLQYTSHCRLRLYMSMHAGEFS